MTTEEKAKAYDKALKAAIAAHKDEDMHLKATLERIFPELKESDDEGMVKFIKNQLFNIKKTITENYELDAKLTKAIDWLEKQGEQKPTKNIVETWKDMRLEVYQQASGNRHEPNYSDDSTKMFSLNDIDEIIEKISEQKPQRMISAEAKEALYDKFAWSIEDERVIGIINNALTESNTPPDDYDKVYDWLESIKQRIGE